MKRKAIVAALAAVFAAGAAYTAYAADPGAPAQKTQRETIYGYRMMNDAERNEYRQKMRDAKTTGERRTLRDDHRKTMEARMKERGIEPGQMRGKGMGPGGPGFGKGGGPAGEGYGKGGGPRGAGKGFGPGNTATQK